MLYSESCLDKTILKRRPYELYKGRKLNISHLHIFGCIFFTLSNRKDNLLKFDAKYNEGILIRYSTFGKALRVFNKRNIIAEELVHVTFDISNPKSLEAEMINCACRLEKTNLEKKDQGPVQDQSHNQVTNEEPT